MANGLKVGKARNGNKCLRDTIHIIRNSKTEAGRRERRRKNEKKSEMACLGPKCFVAVVVKKEGGRRRDGAGPDNTFSNNLVRA